MKKAFWKYFWKFFVALFTVCLFGFLNAPNEKRFFFLSAFLLCGVPTILAILFALIEHKYFPYLNRKAARIFGAKIYDEYHSIASIGKFDLIIKVNIDGSHPIEFHIPRKQIDKKKHKPKFSYVESNTFEVETYLIEKSYNRNLNRIKKKIETEFESISGYK